MPIIASLAHRIQPEGMGDRGRDGAEHLLETNLPQVQGWEDSQSSQVKGFSRTRTGAGLIIGKDLVHSDLYQLCYASYGCLVSNRSWILN